MVVILINLEPLKYVQTQKINYLRLLGYIYELDINGVFRDDVKRY